MSKGGIPVVATTMMDVARELALEPGTWKRALDLQRIHGEDNGIRASIQSISNALRHANQDGLVERRQATGVRGGLLPIFEWSIKPAIARSLFGSEKQ